MQINGKKIIRVFPQKTNMTPVDSYVYFTGPDLFVPEFDEVHISVTFTYDIHKADYLYKSWKNYTRKPVLIGGPAFCTEANEFTPGLYTKKGVVITSRGCINQCSFCLVPKREGKLKELPVTEGNIIQDNNFLACSRKHKIRVYDMLRTKSNVQFTGGLDANLLNPIDVMELSKLKVNKLFLAYDKVSQYEAVKRSINMLSIHFNRHKIYCYVLIGYANDTLEHAEKRCIDVYKLGAKPFAMLYQPANSSDRFNHSLQWRHLQTKWSRPAAFESYMKTLQTC